jgi:uncharacterized repeat protein (TIGR04138 family)
MPAPEPAKTLQEIADELVVYSPEALTFVQEGLSYAANLVHGKPSDPKANRHVSGQQLCEGLRAYALAKWGMMARAVLSRWGITCTMDFGRIVYTLIDAGYMSRNEQDSIEDFRNVYDFKAAFDAGYRIEPEG